MHPNDGRVVSNFIVQALKGEPITIYGEGTQTRSFCYVDDLIEGLHRLMGTADDFTGPVNLGNPAEFTIRELAEKVIALTGSRSALVFKPLPSDDPVQRCPDIGLARAGTRLAAADGARRRPSGHDRLLRRAARESRNRIGLIPVLTPIDFSRLQDALSTPLYWLEIALVFVCLAVAWVLDRRLEALARATEAKSRHPRLRGSVGRIFFSIAALLLLVIARSAFRAAGGTPFFTDIAVPLLVALAIIRMLVYVMRKLFAESAWLKASERAIAFSIWALVILYFIGVLPEVTHELDSIALPIGKSSVSLLTIAKGALAVVVTLVITLWVSSLVDQRLSHATAIDNTTRALLAKLLRAVLLVVGVLIALEAIGFDLTLLTVFGGALGVGVGLGLQKFAANYIAGYTILLEKSIRLGDMITVDGRQGRVAKVSNRFVVLRSLDGIEAMVPNETLITTTVLNHSNATHDIRVSTTVRIAYGADLDLALRLMEDAARAEPRLVSTPEPPVAFVNALGENGIDLELVLWVAGPQVGVQSLRSGVNRRILAAFAAAGIDIPAPRRLLIRDGRETPAQRDTPG